MCCPNLPQTERLASINLHRTCWELVSSYYVWAEDVLLAPMCRKVNFFLNQFWHHHE